MPEDGRNIYKTCRELSGYTQEHAAELLGCSVRALARYEGGEAFPPDDLAVRMDALYSNHFRAYDHLCQTSQVAAALLPSVEDCSLQTAVMRCFNRMEWFLERRPDHRLMEIAEDNVIDENERPDLDLILADLEELTKAFTEVRLAAGRST
nr:helix-turn-helix transcriptional regulator [uncultured Oscillibacter sp.]